MNAHLLGTDVVDVLRSIVADAPPVVFVVNPNRSVVERLINELSGDAPEAVTIRVLGKQATMKSILADFVVASATADLVEDGTLELRSVPEYDRTPMFVTPDRVTALVAVESQVGGLTTAEGTFTGQLFEAIEAEWEAATAFEIRTPARSRITETLEAELGPEVREDFEAVLSALEVSEWEGNGLDEVTISLLVAAKNEVLLYDISKWGEDVGIASKATFSRTKTKLEDYGIIDTEKVPIDVGRPRLRLKFQDESIGGANAAELVEFVRTAMTA